LDEAAAGGREPPTVEQVLTTDRPKARYLIGPDAKRRARVQRLPDRFRDEVLTRFLFGR
jgi:hypothetical protein